MGIQDFDRLIAIREYLVTFPGYHWIVDSDTKTAKKLLINEYGGYLYGYYSHNFVKLLRLKYPKLNFQQFVPDIIDINQKKIIEYQEEPKVGSKPKYNKKGHDEFSDSNKDLFYELGGFSQLKIWESDTDWMDKIEQFLSN